MKKKLVIIVLVGLLFSVSAFSQWNLTGNSGTNPPTNFIGTTDSKALVFKVENTHAGYLQPFSNTSFGFMSLGYVTVTGTNNAAFGSYALRDNTSGIYNSALGCFALAFNTTGRENLAVGANALRDNTIGSYNVAIGAGAAVNNQTGHGLTVIGNMANARNLNNATAIGMDANASINNSVRVGNTSVTRIEGQVSWTSTSDGRVKKNIRAAVPGLEFIKKLQPVTYTMDLDAIDKIMDTKRREYEDPAHARIEEESRKAKEKIIYTGFIAQDVEKAAKSIGFDFSGVDAPQNDKSLYGLRYAEFVVPLVKSVQELNEKDASLQKQVDLLTEQNKSLQEQVNQLSELVFLFLNKDNSEPLPDSRSSSVPNASLGQIMPNPFTSSATISYSLPQSFRSAKIVITAMSGQELRKFPISGAEAGSITITAGSLSSGIYYYSLYVDDMLVDTKKMIVS